MDLATPLQAGAPAASADPSATTPHPQPVTFQAHDGMPLAGTWHLPAGPATRATVLVAGALGVGQRFYAPFAQWLAARGHRVLTFDVRGIGASRPLHAGGRLRGLDIDMLGWARRDFAAAVRLAGAGLPDGTLRVVGHSLGTHHAAMTDGDTQARIGQLVSVAAGSGHWRDWAATNRRAAPLMLHVAGPLLVPLLGWFPGRRLRMVGDLPGPVMRQWSRWCRHPQFAWGAEPALVRPSLESARFPITAFSFTDDEAMTLDCTRQLLAVLPHAPSTLVRIAPQDVGVAAIGHLGAFRPAMAQALWPRLAAALD